MLNLDKIVKKLKNGEKEYFSEFYALTKSAVFYVVKNTLGSFSVYSEDVMQDTYITFLNKLPYIDEGKNYKAYLLSIAKSKSLDELRKHKRIDKSIDPSEMTISVLDTEINGFPLIDYCKKNLKEEEFRLLELAVIYGFKQVEIAKMTKTSVSTVNWRYLKLLVKIRKFYEEVYE